MQQDYAFFWPVNLFLNGHEMEYGAGNVACLSKGCHAPPTPKYPASMTTKHYSTRKVLACSIICLVTLNGGAFLRAQTAPAPRATTQPATKAKEGIVALKEFIVSETEDKGYAATSTSSVTRTQSALIDTPMVVNVLTRAFIDDTQAGELYDALKYVPGVSLESNVGDSVMMRGYTVRNQFTDGIFDNQNQSQMGAEPFQFERLEVLKGPAALVYGSTAIGGLVNRIRKQPQFKPAGQIGLTIGNNNQQKAEFDYTAPINERVAYRVVAVYRNEDMVNGVPVLFAYARRWNLNPMLTWKPTDTTQVRIIGEFMHEKSYKHWGETVMYSTLQQDNNLTGTFFPYPAGTVTTDGLRAEQGGITTFGVLPRDFTFGEKQDHVENRKQSGWLSLESQITPEWSLRTLGTVTFWDHFVEDTFAGSMARNNHEVSRGWRTISNDDFAATFAMDSVYNARILQTDHKFLSILQTQYQSNYQDIISPAVGTPLIPNLDIYNPVHAAYVPLQTRFTNKQYSNNYSFSWAAQDHVKLMEDKLQVVGGARYDWFGNQTRNYLVVSNQVGPRNASQLWTYKYGVVVKPIKGLAGFYNHSETYTPNFGVQPDGTTFEHQRGTIDEIGVEVRRV